MSERYSKLFFLSENLYYEGAPVIIKAGALLKDNNTGNLIAQLKISNITDKIIKLLKVQISCFDFTVGKFEWKSCAVGQVGSKCFARFFEEIYAILTLAAGSYISVKENT